MNEAIRVSLISLGCARNLVDSEVLLGHVVEEGLQVVKEPADADVVVVNTCGFIESAKQESIDTILAVARLKAEGNLKGVIAVGCLAQRYGDELRKDLKELDAVFGLSDYSGVPAVVRKIVNGSKKRWVAPVDGGKPKGPRSDQKRFLLTPKSFAYMRISEGCDHTCTFCAIPKMRGKNRSKPVDVLVEEAKSLAAAGVQELVVVAEDSTAYGLDTTRKRQIHVLLDKLGEVDGIRWIRLMYAYPHTVAPELTTFLREHPKAVKYLDIPIQHISSPMLKAMKRGVSGEQVRGILDRLRSEVPGIAVRSTLIAGFPGETEQDFAAAKALVSDYRFERLGVFPYSQEEETPAFDMPDQVAADVAAARVAELMELQRGIMGTFHQSLVGKTLPVLVDGYDAEAKRVIGRTWADAPEVDARVLLPKGCAEPGQMLQVAITGASDYELVGRQAAAPSKQPLNLPNAITLTRLVLTAGVFVCLELAVRSDPVGVGESSAHAPRSMTALVSAEPTLAWIAFAFFLIAAFTDFLDGYLARKWNLVTAFGRVADPFADKVLIAGSLITLLQFPAANTVLTTWYVVVVVAREFLVTAIRGVVEASGKPFPADQLGKWKMVSQCWTVGAVLSMVAGSGIFVWAAQWGFWVSLLLTVVSGLNYVWKARQILFAGAL